MGKVRFTKKEFDGLMGVLEMMDFDMTVRQPSKGKFIIYVSKATRKKAKP